MSDDLLACLRAFVGPYLGDGIHPNVTRDEIIAEIGRLRAERDALRAALAMTPGEADAEDVAWADAVLSDVGDALDADEIAALRGDAAELAEIGNLLPGYRYMDPPDGGDVSIVEQVRRMSVDAARFRWLAARFTGYDFYWGSDELVCAVFHVGQEFRGGRGIGAAIDAQLAQTGANDVDR